MNNWGRALGRLARGVAFFRARAAANRPGVNPDPACSLVKARRVSMRYRAKPTEFFDEYRGPFRTDAE